jgi:hypothetical protein
MVVVFGPPGWAPGFFHPSSGGPNRLSLALLTVSRFSGVIQSFRSTLLNKAEHRPILFRSKIQKIGLYESNTLLLTMARNLLAPVAKHRFFSVFPAL